MKIIYWSDAALPSRAANTVHVMKMCQAIADNDNELDLIAQEKDVKLTRDDIFSYYGVKKKFNLRLIRFPRVKGGGILYAIKGLRVVKRNVPELLYGRSMYGCYLTASYTQIPVVYEAHDNMEGRRIYETLFRHMICKNNFKALVVITKRLADYYERKYPEIKNKIVVAPDGADLFIGSGELLIKRSENYRFEIGYIGSLYKGRGIDIILEMAKSMPSDRFHVIGGSSEEVNYWKIKANGLTNILFYGQVPPSDVPFYGCSMDILLAPYQENVYSSTSGNSTNTVDYMSPMKIFEYMSFGKIIIASDLDAIKEVLESERNCLLCNPTDFNDWVNAVERLCKEYGLKDRLALMALNEFKLNYTWKERARRVLDSI